MPFFLDSEILVYITSCIWLFISNDACTTNLCTYIIMLDIITTNSCRNASSFNLMNSSWNGSILRRSSEIPTNAFNPLHLEWKHLQC